VLPIVLSGNPSQFPGYFQTIQWMDVRSIQALAMVKKPSYQRATDWQRSMSHLADLLSGMLDDAPAFDPAWSIEKAPSSEQPSSADSGAARPESSSS
jgi:hypothetical protein